jgi:hypothetical protein
MHDDLNIDLVFPIRDDVSAGLMCVKAELLYDAGIINARNLNVVIRRAAAMIGACAKARAGQPSPTRPNVSKHSHYVSSWRNSNLPGDGLGLLLPRHVASRSRSPPSSPPARTPARPS